MNITSKYVEDDKGTPRTVFIGTSALGVAAQTASVSYRDRLTASILERSLVSGAIPEQFRAHVASLINEAPAPVLIRAVDEAAKRHQINPEAIWKNLSRWSHDLQTTRAL